MKDWEKGPKKDWEEQLHCYHSKIGFKNYELYTVHRQIRINWINVLLLLLMILIFLKTTLI